MEIWKRILAYVTVNKVIRGSEGYYFVPKALNRESFHFNVRLRNISVEKILINQNFQETVKIVRFNESLSNQEFERSGKIQGE